MKKLYRYIAFVALAAVLMPVVAVAQRYVEQQDQWKSKIVRASGVDTIRLELHSSFSLEPVNDTMPLIYHEPYPDGLMPKTAIEVAVITIQATSADELVESLEKQARKLGADWIVSFNEPRRRWVSFDGDATPIYRSSATLYRVIDPELVSDKTIATVDCGANHLNECHAVLTWLDEEHHDSK